MAARTAGAAPVVVVAHPSAELYGSDRQCLETVRGLVDAGVRTVVALPDGPLAAAAAETGAEVVAVTAPVLRKSLMTIRGAASLIAASAAALPRLVHLLRSTGADALYVSTLTAPLWVVAGRLAGVPVLVHVHEAEDAVARPVRAALAAPLLLADRVVTNSAASREVLRRSLAPSVARATVLHNGVPGPEHHVPVRAEVAGPLRLALVGRLSPRKGSDVAVEAVAALRDRGVEVRLDLTGDVFPGYEWFEQQLRDRVAELGIADLVALRGLAPSPWPAMQAADVVLVPSRVEPFGNTAVEAMLAGRPLVAAAAQGLREVVRDGVDGALVTPGDAGALADAVLACAADWPAAVERAARARSAAEHRFSPTTYRERIADEVLALVGGRAPSSAGSAARRSA